MLNLPVMAIFAGETETIGVDIGTTGVRLVQLKSGKGDRRLQTYGVTTMEAKLSESDAQVDRSQMVSIIRNLVAQSRATGKKVVSGLPSAKVFSSLVELPQMNPQDMEKAVKFQAEQHIPMALDQVKLDWLPVGSREDGKQEVLIIAAPKTLVERQFSILQEAGLEVVALEPDAMALARALVRPEDNAVVVLDIGANSTDLVTAHNGQPKLIRSIPIGGDTLVKAAAQILNLDIDQALQFVYKFGLAQSKMEGQVKRSIQPSVDNLLSELDKSIKFFTSRYNGVNLDKVVLTGKASMVPELPAYIANSVRLPVEIGNSWLHINTPVNLQAKLMELSNQFAVACGLSLRGMGNE